MTFAQSLRLRHRLAVTVVVVLLFFASTGQATTEPPPRHILLLNSYHQQMSWVRDIVTAVEAELQPENNNLVLQVEDMDTKRFPGEDYRQTLFDSYRAKYRGVTFDLLLASDNNAYNFLLKHRDRLFPNVPIVFCGVNDFQPEKLAGQRDITGVAEIFSFASTVQTALRLHPGTREIFVINDYLETGRAWEKTMRREIAGLKLPVRFNFAENLPLPALQKKIHSLEPGMVVLLGAYFSDASGHYLTYEKTGALLSEASRVPVYGLLEFNVGNGVIGGEVISGFRQGQQMALLAKKILQGVLAEDLPIVTVAANHFVFDHQQLVRFGLDQAELPPGSMVLNRPFSLYQQYKVSIWVVVGTIGLLLGTSCGLLLLVLYLNKTKGALRASQSQLRESLTQLGKARNYIANIIDSMPSMLIGVNPAGQVTQWNLETQRLTGLTSAQAQGQDLGEVLPRLRQERSRIARAIELRTTQQQHKVPDLYEDRSRLADLTIYPLVANGVEGAVIRVDDVTDKQCLEDQIALRLHDMQLTNDHLQQEIRERQLVQQQLCESEERFRVTFEQAAMGIAHMNPDGSYLLVNQRLCEIFGYSQQGLLAVSSQAITHPDDWGSKQRRLQQLASSAIGHLTLEHRCIKSDGSVIQVNSSYSAVRNAQGKFQNIIALVEDISQRKQFETRLAQHSRIETAIAECSKKMFLLDTVEQTCQMVLDTALAMTASPLGYVGYLDHSSGALVCPTLHQPVTPATHFQELNSLWEWTQQHQTSLLCNDPAGESDLPDRLTLRRILTVPVLHDRQLLGQLAVANADSDYLDTHLYLLERLAAILSLGIRRNQISEELRRAQAASEASVRAKRLFLANMSHEIRTPLNGIFGMLQLLRETDLRAEQQEYVDTALHSGQGLLTLIEDILDLSKIEEGRVKIVDGVFSFRHLLGSIHELFRTLHDPARVALIFDLKEGVPDRIVGDVTRIRQVLFNLIGNALKFTEQGAVTTTVDLAGTEPPALQVIIADSGVGIPEAFLTQIFSPFSQADSSHQRKFQGAGLGLAIVRNLVELMGGEIAIDSREGSGTTVRVRLPLILPPAQPAEETLPPATQEAATPTTALNLLLAEDNPVNRLVVQRLLGKLGHTVEIAENGRAVLDLLERRRFDCILMDIQMPLMAGDEATRIIRNSPQYAATSKIPIIAMTAHAMKGDMEKFLAAGMDDYLAKPISLVELGAMLKRVAANSAEREP